MTSLLKIFLAKQFIHFIKTGHKTIQKANHYILLTNFSIKRCIKTSFETQFFRGEEFITSQDYFSEIQLKLLQSSHTEQTSEGASYSPVHLMYAEFSIEVASKVIQHFLNKFNLSLKVSVVLIEWFGNEQCDQMARPFLNLWQFTTMEIGPIAHNILSKQA